MGEPVSVDSDSLRVVLDMIYRLVQPDDLAHLDAASVDALRAALDEQTWKPDPEVVKRYMDEWGVNEEDAVSVLASGHDAGLDVVLREDATEEPAPAKLVADPELLDDEYRKGGQREDAT